MTTKAFRLAQPSARQLLSRLLDDSSLVATIQGLEPRSLGKLIRHVGLEDCGEIVSLATTDQIKQIFDDDLWKSERPGKDEKFDADRFGLWLEVMLEAGEDFVAEKLTELSEDLVTLALHRHILVVNIDELRNEMDGGDEGDIDLTDKALESCLYHEFDEYQVISRRHNDWDTILAILLALDKNDHALLERILDRCSYMSREYIEENGGLYDVLNDSEMLEDDVAGEREDRRAREGFIAPSAAASFLSLARMTAPKDVIANDRDAVTRAYFRDLALAKPVAATKSAAPQLTARGDPQPATSAVEIERMIVELDAAEAPRDAKPIFLGECKAGARGSEVASLFGQALAALAADDPKVHGQRLDELAYLCNVLVAGCAIGTRAFRPFEAVVAVAAACNLGLEKLLGQEGNGKLKKGNAVVELAVRVVARDGADKLFRVGFHLLHGEIVTSACQAVERVLALRARKATDPDVRKRLDRVVKEAQTALSAQKPWQVHRRVEALGRVFDESTKESLLALLSEYPLLVGKLSKLGTGKYQIDDEHQFLATAEQIGRVRVFLDGL